MPIGTVRSMLADLGLRIGVVANGWWRTHSASDDVFADLEQGRSILVQAARNQVVARERTASCCIALVADGRGRYRLWRIERMS